MLPFFGLSTDESNIGDVFVSSASAQQISAEQLDTERPFPPNNIRQWQAILQGCIMALKDRVENHLTSQRTDDLHFTVVAIRTLPQATLRNLT